VTELGLKPIRDIKIGDRVWAYDENTGEKVLQEIVHLIKGEGSKELVDITLENGEVITATTGHPFYVDGEWVDAGALSSLNKLFGLKKEPVDIVNLKTYSVEQVVYNLTVDTDHTYYVGKSGVLSHNEGPECDPLVTQLGATKGGFSRIVPGGGLAAHELAGGHLIARHVGQSEAQLLSRLASNSRITGASSFTNRAVAESSVSSALSANQAAIQGFLSGSSNRLVINHSLSSPVGISVSRGASNAASASSVRVVLQRDSSLSTGYRIVTGFPTL